MVKGFRQGEIEKLAKAGIAPGTNVVSDGQSCWRAVSNAGCDHWPAITGAARQAARCAPFTWVNTTRGNIKTALARTHHLVSAKHAQRYLISFAWRFNRRYQLDSLAERLAFACIHASPHPYEPVAQFPS